MRRLFYLLCLLFFPYLYGMSQQLQKIYFNSKDSINGYYLASIPPSKKIDGTVIFLCGVESPERMVLETKLHNVAAANNLLTVIASTGTKLYADSAALQRINAIISNVLKTYAIDSSKIILSGFDYAGTIALRYTEIASAKSPKQAICPKGVFTVDSPVDLFSLWTKLENQVSENFVAEDVTTGKFIIGLMTKEYGDIRKDTEGYEKLTPFHYGNKETGNEKYLKDIAVRLYYDDDIMWRLKNKHSSYYDTYLPDASALIKRLSLLKNDRAEFITSSRSGVRSDGSRNPNSMSIVDEVECIQWIKRTLNIFDPITWVPPYNFFQPEGWRIERTPFPPEFASQIPYNGVQDIRFAKGWADSASDAYWSYTYVWWMNGKVSFTKNGIQKALTQYYQGLTNRNIERRNIPADKIIPVSVTLSEAPSNGNDSQTFSGSIKMLDYFTQSPISLNCTVHNFNCGDTKHSAVLFELSPQSFDRAIWKQLDSVRKSFNCANDNHFSSLQK